MLIGLRLHLAFISMVFCESLMLAQMEGVRQLFGFDLPLDEAFKAKK